MMMVTMTMTMTILTTEPYRAMRHDENWRNRSVLQPCEYPALGAGDRRGVQAQSMRPLVADRRWWLVPATVLGDKQRQGLGTWERILSALMLILFLK